MPTIKYQLSAQPSSLDAIVDPMHALRRAARLLPTREVLPLLLIGTEEIRAADADNNHPLHALVRSLERSIGVDFETGNPSKSVSKSTGFHLKLPANRIVGFSVYPGFGADRIDLFVSEHPRVIPVPGQCQINGQQPEPLAGIEDWMGRGCCVTGNRDSVLIDFLVSHVLVVVLLETAQTLGLSVQVSDPAGFYEKRSLANLIKAFPGDHPPNWFDHREHIESLGNLAVLADVEDVEIIPT